MAGYWNNSASYGQYQQTAGYEQYPPQQQGYGGDYGYGAPQQVQMPPQHMGYQQQPQYPVAGRPHPQQQIQPVPYQGYAQPARQHVPPQPSPQFPQTPRQEPCAICGIIGHWAQDCPTQNQNKPQLAQPPLQAPTPAPVRPQSAQNQPMNPPSANDPYGTGQQPVYNEPCYNCGGSGHWAQYCPEGRRPHPFGQKGTPSQPPTPMTAVPPASKYGAPNIPQMPREISTPAAPVPYSPQHPALQTQSNITDQKKDVTTPSPIVQNTSAKYSPEDEGEIFQDAATDQNHVDVKHDSKRQSVSNGYHHKSYDSVPQAPNTNGVKHERSEVDTMAKSSHNTISKSSTSPVVKHKLENGVSNHSVRHQQNGTRAHPPPPPPPRSNSVRDEKPVRVNRNEEDRPSRTPVPETAPTQAGDDPFGPAYEDQTSPPQVNGKVAVKRRRTDSVSDSELLDEGSAPEPERPRKRVVDKAYR